MPAASRVGELRPSAATSSGALSLRPSASATRTPSASRSTDGDRSISTAARCWRRPRRGRARRRASGGSRASSRAARRRRPDRSAGRPAAARRRPGSGGSARPVRAGNRRRRSSAACASSSTTPRWCGRRTRRPCALSGSAGSTTIALKPARVQRRGEREADHPSTEDDDVGAIHRLCP